MEKLVGVRFMANVVEAAGERGLGDVSEEGNFAFAHAEGDDGQVQIRPQHLRLDKRLTGLLVLAAAAAASPNMGNDKTGNINKIFKYIYSIRLVGKKLKAYNYNLYYAVKYALLVLILWAVFFRALL